jgi:uncharacterized membrane protein HdeD (DUF308 family)
MRLNAIETIREHWGWFLALGIIFILGGIFAIAAPFVGLIIIIQWPVSTAYALGYLAGISLIFSGWSYVMMSLAAKRI